MSAVYTALQPLRPQVQAWILDAVIARLGLEGTRASPGSQEAVSGEPAPMASPVLKTNAEDPKDASSEQRAAGSLEGVSSVAQRWLSRTGLSSPRLGDVFSLDFDEIDLVARSVPGENKKARMRSVLILKAIASYLSSGVPRVPYEKVREACIHYDAYDGDNFAAYLKSLAKEIAGTKEVGFSLTPSGMTAASLLLKQMMGVASPASPSQAKSKSPAQ